MTDESDDFDLAACEELYRQIVVIFQDLARDAEGHGFDVTPYLERLAALDIHALLGDRPRKGFN